MHFWRHFLVSLIPVLLLTGCDFYRGAQAIQPAVTPQNTPSTIALKEVVTPRPVTSTAPTTESPIPPATCPVTRPPSLPFIPPSPYPNHPPVPGDFWYGDTNLWTVLPKTGVWSTLPHNPKGYTQKVFWWRKGYSWKDEPQPQLSVTGRRLDAPAPPLHVSRATNVFAEDIQSAMLVGVDFPSLGCWEISGRYAGTELSFVVWIAP